VQRLAVARIDSTRQQAVPIRSHPCDDPSVRNHFTIAYTAVCTSTNQLSSPGPVCAPTFPFLWCVFPPVPLRRCIMQTINRISPVLVSAVNLCVQTQTQPQNRKQPSIRPYCSVYAYLTILLSRQLFPFPFLPLLFEITSPSTSISLHP
jgi:hypothetical protein